MNGDYDQAHDEWRTKVRRYIGAGDRGEEPCYVGRAELFEKVGSMVETARDGERDRRTIVVSGAHGAGKTAFLRELAKRWQKDAVVVALRPGGMKPIRLFRAVSAVLSVPAAEREDRTRTREVGAGAAVVKGKVSTSTTSVSPGDVERLRESDEVPWGLLKERFGAHLGVDRPLILPLRRSPEHE